MYLSVSMTTMMIMRRNSITRLRREFRQFVRSLWPSYSNICSQFISPQTLPAGVFCTPPLSTNQRWGTCVWESGEVLVDLIPRGWGFSRHVFDSLNDFAGYHQPTQHSSLYILPTSFSLKCFSPKAELSICSATFFFVTCLELVGKRCDCSGPWRPSPKEIGTAVPQKDFSIIKCRIATQPACDLPWGMKEVCGMGWTVHCPWSFTSALH